MAGVSSSIDRRLPRGWIDLARQVALFLGVYLLYRLVRGLVEGEVAVAFENARRLIDLERAAGLFFEPAVHAWAVGQSWLVDGASFLYVNSHLVVTTAFLVWLYLRRNDSFYCVRNMFIMAMCLALVGYVVFPTAPPRFLPEWGFTDTVADFFGRSASGSASLLYNPFAAVPSMHVAFALMVGVPAARLVRPRTLRAIWIVYPLLVTFVVVITANHFWVDAALGALVAGVSAYAAQAGLGRLRPDIWAWRDGLRPRTAT